MADDWHKTSEFQQSVRAFHEAYARQPCGEDLEAAKRILEVVKVYIAAKMKEQGLFENKRYEHRGSTYEGVKVKKSPNDDDLEFDIMYVIAGGTDLEEHGLGPDGYAKLKAKPGKEARKVFQKTTKNGFISASETRNQFFSQLDMCDLSQIDCTAIGYRKGDITLKKKYHGPAVEIVVDRYGRKLFSIDLAPHYDLCGITGQEKMYVPKAPTDDLASANWFRSYSLDEKRKFDAMDRDNGCRKMVLRIVKVLRKRTVELKALKSNQLKIILFRVVDKQPSWKQDQLGIRLMDFFKELESTLVQKNLPHYYMPRVNLFEKLSEVTMDNMAYRLKELQRSKVKMMELIKV